MHQSTEEPAASRMLEPFGEAGGDVPEYFSSRTHFAKIKDKKVIAKNSVEKLNSWSLGDDLNKPLTYCQNIVLYVYHALYLNKYCLKPARPSTGYCNGTATKILLYGNFCLLVGG